MQDPVLALPDLAKPFEVQTDAPDFDLLRSWLDSFLPSFPQQATTLGERRSGSHVWQLLEQTMNPRGTHLEKKETLLTYLAQAQGG